MLYAITLAMERAGLFPISRPTPFRATRWDTQLYPGLVFGGKITLDYSRGEVHPEGTALKGCHD